MNKTENKNKFLLLSILCTLAAVGVFSYLSLHYYQVKFGMVEGESICNINQVLNCDAVSASKFSSFFGVPVALWGLGTNLVLLFFLLFTRYNLTQNRAKTSRYAFLLSLVTVIASIVMASISALAMKNLCIFCISSYFLSLIGFWSCWMGAENIKVGQLIEDIKDIFVTDRWVIGYSLLIPIVAFLGNIMYLESHGLSDLEKIATDKVTYWQSAPAQNFDLSKGLSLQVGSGDPSMTIVEFADFRCPHCKHAAPSLHTFVLSHPDTKLIFKPFPLDGTCNSSPGMKGSGDGISCGLAFAVMCAEKINKTGWKAHDYLFENQMSIIEAQSLDKNLEALAPVLGISKDDLQKCVDAPETRELVQKTAQEGVDASIRGTPSIFVNGKPLELGQLIPVLESAYKTIK